MAGNDLGRPLSLKEERQNDKQTIRAATTLHSDRRGGEAVPATVSGGSGRDRGGGRAIPHANGAADGSRELYVAGPASDTGVAVRRIQPMDAHGHAAAAATGRTLGNRPHSAGGAA